jgi:hypothetical protein
LTPKPWQLNPGVGQFAEDHADFGLILTAADGPDADERHCVEVDAVVGVEGGAVQIVADLPALQDRDERALVA